MKKLMIALAFVCAGAVSASAQKIAIKNNLLGDATTSLNLGAEFRLAPRSTLDLYVSWNPFELNGNKQLRHILIQPEYRYWTCEAFNGLFFGVHALGIPAYNVGGIKLPFGLFPELAGHRYDGWAYGGGLTVGYQWILGRRWNLEAAVGAGYAYIDYSKYECRECAPKIGGGHHNYLGLTKLSLSLIFFFN